MDLFLGIDVGTSGVRTAVIDAEGTPQASAAVAMPAPERIDDRPCQDPETWWRAVCDCLYELGQQIDLSTLCAVAVDGTSGTLLLADTDLKPVTPGYLYNSGGFDTEAKCIEPHAPENTLARGAGSGLARLLFLQSQPGAERAAFALHQADWIAARLMGRGGFSDETNALKTGYDLQTRSWPDWLAACGANTSLLPKVLPVGETYGPVSSERATEFGWPEGVRVVAGVTDSNAAFLASGASRVGDGVTSLGTTLAIKLLSDRPVSDSARGVYSHRIGDMWLPGGASNSGGGVLAEHFTREQMDRMTPQLDPDTPTGLDYYPLIRPGERFPHADPNFPPRVTPRPDNDVHFFQGLLEGIAAVEEQGYAALRDLGAPPAQRIFTAGGGAKNPAWTTIRQRTLNLPLLPAHSGDAAVGTARVAAGLIQ